ncbi:unnamed protein product [Cyprideis torosa]|uniref:asparaginase n=1 Tax=Cyprideis torosa TaxID=163714 RepID=A0A7R8W3P9_9CRUS|nr:unnamed protein product [Cyprideis torosa]CAG0881117.1 unnamed protein product [Cyprideis torosa]
MVPFGGTLEKILIREMLKLKQHFNSQVEDEAFRIGVPEPGTVLAGCLTSSRILPAVNADSPSDTTHFVESRVLVLYTGGTIGMMKNDQGALAPVPYQLEHKLRSFPHLHDKECADRIYRNPFGNSPLILPATEERKRIVYCVYEYEPLLDSCNMTMEEYRQLALDLERCYQHFDGFVILHGTDTLAYTASALSFMLQDLGKPVVLTGSQIPIFETRSDGRDNFLGALIMAGNYVIPEVTIFFNNKLFRGNRTTKINPHDFEAFDSPNLPPLATVGITIKVESSLIFKPTSIRRFSVHSQLCQNLSVIRVFPSMALKAFQNSLAPPCEGVVLHTYGSGNMPNNRPDLLEALKDANDRGVIILNITQCHKGGTGAAAYATGQALLRNGVIPGSDMTPETAISKLSYVLSKSEWPMEMKKQKLMESLRGELTKYEVAGPSSNLVFITAIGKSLGLTTSQELEHLREAILPCILNSATQIAEVSHVQDIIDQGADPSTSDYDLRTPIHIAASEGNLRMVEMLLQKGARIHEKDRNGHTALQNAIDFGHLDVVKLLIQAGAHLPLTSNEIGLMLCTAALRDDIRQLQALELCGVDMTTPDITGRNALHVAVLAEHQTVIEFLKARNLHLDVPDKLGMKPSDLATMIEQRTFVMGGKRIN